MENWPEADKTSFAHCVARLQIAEATPYLNLRESEIIAFKRKLACGYTLGFQRKFNAVDSIIEESLMFLHQRNMEAARTLSLEAGGIIAVIVAIIGLILYLHGCGNKWYYGIIFGILGAYVSIWTRYGKLAMTGLARKWLHYLEVSSRLFIGAIFAVVVMFAIKCGLVFSNIGSDIAVFEYSLAGFISGFNERFIPSLIEKIINNDHPNNEQKTDNDHQ